MHNHTREAVHSGVEAIARAIDSQEPPERRRLTLDDGGRIGDRSAQIPSDTPVVTVPVGTSLDEAERWIVLATLRRCGGNKTRAAAMLGVSLKTLYNRLHAYRAADARDAAQTADA